MLDPDLYVRPYQDRIHRLEQILRESPTLLVVRHGAEVMELVGNGERIMAMELERYRKALDDIATGKVSKKDAADFAANALERQ